MQISFPLFLSFSRRRLTRYARFRWWKWGRRARKKWEKNGEQKVLQFEQKKKTSFIFKYIDTFSIFAKKSTFLPFSNFPLNVARFAHLLQIGVKHLKTTSGRIIMVHTVGVSTASGFAATPPSCSKQKPKSRDWGDVVGSFSRHRNRQLFGMVWEIFWVEDEGED